MIDKETAKKFGRTFHLMDKVDVNGAKAAPLFKEFLNPDSKVLDLMSSRFELVFFTFVEDWLEF